MWEWMWQMHLANAVVLMVLLGLIVFGIFLLADAGNRRPRAR